MYNQSNLATGTKWFFYLAIVILIGAFALGFNIKDAKWLNNEIASATAEQMNAATDVERQKADLDLQLLRTQTEIQIAQQRQQAEYAAEKQQQELEASAVAHIQRARFQQSLYSAFSLGLVAVMIAVSIALTVIGINAGIGLYKVLNSKAQAIQLSKPSTVMVNSNHHRPSPAAQKAREREREERDKQFLAKRRNQIFRETEQIWPSDEGKSENPNTGNYPQAN